MSDALNLRKFFFDNFPADNFDKFFYVSHTIQSYYGPTETIYGQIDQNSEFCYNFEVE